MIALAALVRGNQFSFRVNRAECPHVTEGWIVCRYAMLFFLTDESPDFIKLQIVTSQTAHLGIENLRAALPNTHAQTHNCVTVNARHSLDGPNARTLSQRRNNRDLLFSRKYV